MTRRPIVTDNVVNLDEAGFRFKWLERDIKEMKDAHSNLSLRLTDVSTRLDKINLNIKLAAAVIIGLGIGSRLLSSDVIELVKKIAGF